MRHATAARTGALVGALALACLAMPPSAPAAKQRGVYYGAHIGAHLTGTPPPYDMSAVTKFEALTGKGLSAVAFGAPFAECYSKPCTFNNFPTSLFESLRQYGAIPFFSWSSQGIPGGLNQPDFQLRDVLNGDFDSYIRSFAEGAKSWGHPFFLRFNPEMNGDWFAWSERRNGNKRGEFVPVWRHVHNIFTSVGVTNATWVWCPNVNVNNDKALQRNIRTLYPGGKYVDWTCLDGFNWGARSDYSIGWLTFAELFGKTYRRVVKLAPNKPMILGEVATSSLGGSKAAWIRNMFHTIPARYPKIRGLMWYDVHDRNSGWPIESSGPKAKRAFRRGVRRGAYRANEFSNLAASPIPPPH